MGWCDDLYCTLFSIRIIFHAYWNEREKRKWKECASRQILPTCIRGVGHSCASIGIYIVHSSAALRRCWNWEQGYRRALDQICITNESNNSIFPVSTFNVISICCCCSSGLVLPRGCILHSVRCSESYWMHKASHSTSSIQFDIRRRYSIASPSRTSIWRKCQSMESHFSIN